MTDTAVAAGSGLGAEVTLLGSEEEGKNSEWEVGANAHQKIDSSLKNERFNRLYNSLISCNSTRCPAANPAC